MPAGAPQHHRTYVRPPIEIRAKLPKQVAYKNPTTNQYTMVPILTKKGAISTRNGSKLVQFTLDNTKNSRVHAQHREIPLDRFSPRGQNRRLAQQYQNLYFA
jgi:hypothetical protein